jgi:peptide/nickel transport system substrate-binding protein
MRHRVIVTCVAIFAILAMALGGTSANARASTSVTPKSGGSLTDILIGDTWPGLNPETNTIDALDDIINDAIFGGLFERTAKGVVPDLASGYTFSNAYKTLTIHLRQGVKFQDGTSMNATAVAAEINASLLPSNGCICDSDFAPVKSVQASGTYNVVLRMSTPYPAIISAFIGEAPNWPISTTALAKEGAAQFAQNPVGAGPYEVVSNVASSKLVLKKYTGYWQAGHPYVNQLTFENVGSDQTALQAVQTGSAQLVEGIATASDIKQAMSNSQVNVIQGQGVTTEWIQVNSDKAPFNNLQAREALYYATDSAAVLKAVQLGLGVVSQSPAGPGGLYYEPQVAGYRAYNLARAKALVSQVGGITTTLVVLDDSAANVALGEALASEWAAAGIKTNLDQVTIGQYLQLQESHGYALQITTGGGYNPSVGIDGLVSRVAGKIGGENDTAINGLIQQTLEVANPTKLSKVYDQIYSMISSQAYGPYIYAPPAFVVAAKSLTGVVPLSSQAMPLIQWEDVWFK